MQGIYFHSHIVTKRSKALNNNIISVYSAISTINELLWGIPVLGLILSGGLYLSFRLRFPQIHIFRLFRDVIRSLRSSESSKGLSQLQGFSTALAATVGTGSVTGVACALYTGGRGCIFWMWVSAFLGMGLSYCENFLSVTHSKLSQKGSGAFCYLRSVSKPLAVSYSLFCVLASLGMGNMAQASSAVSAASLGLGLPRWICAVGVVVFCCMVVWDTQRCAKLCERLIPVGAGIFIAVSLTLVLIHPYASAEAVCGIFKDALSFKACAGGTVSWYFTKICVNGLRRGAFSHEAGLGTTCAVHSDCGVKDAQLQGKLAMSEVFIDTMVICTVTALVILCSGTDFYSCADATQTVINAYSACIGGTFAGRLFTCVCLTLFSLCTLTGWFYIGQSSFCCLFAQKALLYKVIYLFCAYLGTSFSLRTVWDISDIFNALMAIPNLTGVLMLSGQIQRPKFRRLRDG